MCCCQRWPIIPLNPLFQTLKICVTCVYNGQVQVNDKDYWGKKHIGLIVSYYYQKFWMSQNKPKTHLKTKKGRFCEQLFLLLARLWIHSPNRAAMCTNGPQGNLKSTYKSLSPDQLWDTQTKIISPECCWNFHEMWTRPGSGYFWPGKLRHLTEKTRVDKVSNQTRSGLSCNVCTPVIYYSLEFNCT